MHLDPLDIYEQSLQRRRQLASCPRVLSLNASSFPVAAVNSQDYRCCSRCPPLTQVTYHSLEYYKPANSTLPFNSQAYAISDGYRRRALVIQRLGEHQRTLDTMSPSDRFRLPNRSPLVVKRVYWPLQLWDPIEVSGGCLLYGMSFSACCNQHLNKGGVS